VRQIVAAGFLARLDQNDAARMRDALVMQGGDRGKRAEHGIAVIGAATAKELVTGEDRGPRSAAFAPPDHLRLLVEMTVEQHAIVARTGNIDEDHRRPLRQPHDLERRTLDRRHLPPRPALEQGDGVVHVAMRRPFGVESRRFVGDADVFDQLRHDLVAPALIDEAHELRPIHIAPSYSAAAARPRCFNSAPIRGSRPRKAT
jgi:hypothetical protein